MPMIENTFCPENVNSILICTGWLGLASPPFRGESYQISRESKRFCRRRLDLPVFDEVSYADVAKLLTELARLFDGQPGWGFRCTDDYPSLRVKVQFRSGDVLIAHSQAQGARMIPWSIYLSSSEEERDSSNPAIGPAIASLLPDSAENWSRLTAEVLTESEWRKRRSQLTHDFRLKRNASSTEPAPVIEFEKRLLDLAWAPDPAERIRELLVEGVDLNAVSPKGYTALIEAIRWGKFEAAKLLLSFGVAVNVPSSGLSGPLAHCCCRIRKPEELDLLRLLLDAGAIVEPCLHEYLGNKRVRLGEEIGELLLSSNPTIDWADERGWTGLHHASASPERFITPWVKAGANVNATTKTGETPLMLAVGQAEKLRLLLESGAEVSLIDQRGWTALRFAVENQCVSSKSLQLLLDAGANPLDADPQGISILDVARSRLRSVALRQSTQKALQTPISSFALSEEDEVLPSVLTFIEQLRSLPASVQLLQLAEYDVPGSFESLYRRSKVLEDFRKTADETNSAMH